MERYLKNITIQQMKTLVCLAEERSFSRAARKMYLTQPSITKHIKNLEAEAGVPLVDRKSGEISLTPEGKILCESAKRVFGLIDDTGEKIARMKENESGSIRIAASTIPATYILPHSLSKFRDRHKDIHCCVRTNDSDLTLDMILNDEAEIGFIGREIAGRKLCTESLWSDRLVLVVPASHKWSERESIPGRSFDRTFCVKRTRFRHTQSAGRIPPQKYEPDPFRIQYRLRTGKFGGGERSGPGRPGDINNFHTRGRA